MAVNNPKPQSKPEEDPSRVESKPSSPSATGNGEQAPGAEGGQRQSRLGEISGQLGRLIKNQLQAASSMFKKDEGTASAGSAAPPAPAAISGSQELIWQAVREIHAACGANADQSTICKVLEDKSSAQRREIAVAFERRFGVALEERLKEKLSGNQLSRALHLFRRSDSEQKAEQIYLACTQLVTDEAAILNALDGQNGAEVLEIAKYYRTIYGVTLQEVLSEELSGPNFQKALIILRRSQSGGSKGSDTRQPEPQTPAQQKSVAQPPRPAQAPAQPQSAAQPPRSAQTPAQPQSAAQPPRSAQTPAQPQSAEQPPRPAQAPAQPQSAAQPPRPAQAPAQPQSAAQPPRPAQTPAQPKPSAPPSEPATARSQQETHPVVQQPEWRPPETLAAEIHAACNQREGMPIILQILQAGSYSERRAISASFEKQFGVSLLRQLQARLAGEELVRAIYLLQRTDAAQGAERLFAIFCQVEVDAKAVCEMLENKSHRERQVVAEAYEKQYGMPLPRQFQASLIGVNLIRAMYLLRRTEVAQKADQIFSLLSQPAVDKMALATLFQNVSLELLNEVGKYYLSSYDINLKESLNRIFGKDMDSKDMSVPQKQSNVAPVQSNDLTRSNSTQSRLEAPRPQTAQTGPSIPRPATPQAAPATRPQSVNATSVRNAIENIRAAIGLVSADEAAIRNALAGKTQPERLAIVREYQTKYGVSLESQLQEEFSGEQLSSVLSLLR